MVCLLVFLPACTPIEYKALDSTFNKQWQTKTPVFTDGKGNCVAFATAHAKYLGRDRYSSGLALINNEWVRHAWVESDGVIIDNDFITRDFSKYRQLREARF